MAKSTFNNLNADKKEKIIEVLTDIFKEKPFYDVTVKEIVEKLSIARGSFYQYFEDLEDAYFMILDRNIDDVHKLFMDLIIKNKDNLEKSLNEYGYILSDVLFKENTYKIYKNRYLFWDEKLNRRWDLEHNYDKNFYNLKNHEIKELISKEKIEYLKGIIHNLIKRVYKENLSKEEFLEKYYQQMNWVIGGI